MPIKRKAVIGHSWVGSMILTAAGVPAANMAPRYDPSNPGDMTNDIIREQFEKLTCNDFNQRFDGPSPSRPLN